MTTVAQVLGLLVWIPPAALGAYNLVTGRKFRFRDYVGLPNWPLRDGWPIRLFGLVYVLAGAFITTSIVRNGITWEPVVAAYFFTALSIGILLWRSPRKSAGRGEVTAPR